MPRFSFYSFTLYDKLSYLDSDIPVCDHILICGNLIITLTAVGCWVKNVCGEPSSNLGALQVFINHHNLVAENGIVRQKRSKFPTFDGSWGGCTRLDWMCVRNRFRPCVCNVINIKTTVFTSDHQLLSIDY